MKFIIVLLLLSLSNFVFAAKIKSISELNPDFENAIINALKAKNETGNIYKERAKPLSLFHFSDIHGDEVELERYCKFLDKYGKYFDDAICTGDLIGGNFFDGFEYWGKVKGAEKILLTIGNHDALNSKDWDWTQITPIEEMYKKYYAPYISNWNVKCKENTTYYYKDYESQKIRLIALDCSLTNKPEEVQYEWFKDIVTNAKSKNLAIIIAYHFPVRDYQPIKCNWSAPFISESGWYASNDKYQQTIDEFMNEGGEFICWLGGHTHFDSIGFNKNFPKQLNIIIDATSRWQCEYYSDLMRTDGTKNMDLANAFVVDTYSNTIKLIRIGANINSYMTPRNQFCINYKTFEIMSQN